MEESEQKAKTGEADPGQLQDSVEVLGVSHDQSGPGEPKAPPKAEAEKPAEQAEVQEEVKQEPKPAAEADR